MKKKYTLSIAIPAYNEAANIKNLLAALVQQKNTSFSLKEITVYSDGSTDKTGSIVRAFSKKYPQVTLVASKERKGKYFRVNQIFRNCKTDVLIILDADIALAGENCLEKLVTPLLSDPKAMMVAAHNILVRPDNFIGKIIHTNFVLWDNIRLSVPNYDNAANFYGSATGYRGSFARSLIIPDNLTDPHLFIYLAARKVDGFRYCRQAEVLQYPLTTMNDLKKFLNRSIGKKDPVLEKMFNVKIEDVYYFSRRCKLVGLLKTFLWQPLYTPLAIMLSLYIARFMPAGKRNNSPVWDITVSSKKPLQYAK